MSSATHRKMQALLDSEGIRFFNAREALFLGAANEQLKLNTYPPEALWPAIIPTLRVLDLARLQVGRISLLSIYRNEAYNRAIGGAKASIHMRYAAADARPLDATPQQLYDVLLKLRTDGVFRGGLSRYPRFVHVDTRGHNTDF